MVAWPSDLPQEPINGGFDETLPDLVIRSTMDTGPQKVRRRYSAGPRTMKMKFIMTPAQVATLDTFYTTYVATAFTWVHPRTQVANSCRFTGGRPQISHKDKDWWDVSIDVEQLP